MNYIPSRTTGSAGADLRFFGPQSIKSTLAI